MQLASPEASQATLGSTTQSKSLRRAVVITTATRKARPQRAATPPRLPTRAAAAAAEAEAAATATATGEGDSGGGGSGAAGGGGGSGSGGASAGGDGAGSGEGDSQGEMVILRGKTA